MIVVGYLVFPKLLNNLNVFYEYIYNENRTFILGEQLDKFSSTEAGFTGNGNGVEGKQG